MSRRVFLLCIPTWLFTAIVTAAILWLTLAPEPLPDDSLPLIPGIDKIGHACMFAGLTLAIFFDLGLRQYKRGQSAAYTHLRYVEVAAIVIIFGLLTEFLQEAIGAGRDGDILDWCADLAGTLLALAIVPRCLTRLFNH